VRRRGEILLDVDSTDDPTHGAQQLSMFNGHYGQPVYHPLYNGRGECENRIAELKNGFHADRLSCHRFLANAFRLVLHSLAYNLVNLFRQQLPEALRTLQIGSLRTRLFKVGARVRQTARWVWVHLASGWPHQNTLQDAARACS
jgi:hypothetical protein